MEELKRMLIAIHEENKAILSLLCADNYETDEEFGEVYKEISKMCNKLFYGKDDMNERIKD